MGFYTWQVTPPAFQIYFAKDVATGTKTGIAIQLWKWEAVYFWVKGL